jgi:hypothetical protein
MCKKTAQNNENVPDSTNVTSSQGPFFRTDLRQRNKTQGQSILLFDTAIIGKSALILSFRAANQTDLRKRDKTEG